MIQNRISACPVCKNRNYTLRHKVHNFQYIICSKCKVVRLDPFPTAEEVAGFYTIDDYFKNQDRNIGYTDYEAQRYGLVKTAENRFKKAMHYTNFNNCSILELGCGLGYAASALKKFRDIEYLGIDPNPQAIKSIQKLGFKGKIGTITNLDITKKFDWIIFFDVFEHIISPNCFLSSLNKHISKSGTIIFTTPNTKSLLSKISGSRWVSYIIPQHLLLYNPKSISDLLKKHGYSNIHIFTDFQWVSMDLLLNRLGDFFVPLKKIGQIGQSFFKKFPFICIPNGNMLVIATK